ncbi:hypothetical protein F8M41_013535 [Gigaspora margarita]|uniref:Uncharacterized protein n=1 Tax=Gigaspora margarita TaxID=4874 RepID=A0A8H4EP99_GIGMA|nr:hypothetical protein F8M41_013535 [Gigaspora margarita]
MLPSYFQLLPPKPYLPVISQELNLATRQLFFCDSKDSTDFRHHINILRKHYMFRRILRDYFKQKLRLPEKPEDIHMSQKDEFPISNKNIAKQFIAEIQEKFRFTILLFKKYMNINSTDKPELSQDVNEISQMHLTIPIISPKILVETARELRKYYFFYELSKE